MLDQALKLITRRLSSYIEARYDLDESVVELASPVSPDGVMPVEANDKLLVFLSGVHKETLSKGATYSAASGDGLSRGQPLSLNLYIFVAANFRTQKYQDGLAFLSDAIRCFQQTPVLDRHVQPEMPADIEKLILDIENTDLHQASNLWGILGGKYLPSVFYKVRMLTLAPQAVTGRVVPASTPESTLGR